MLVVIVVVVAAFVLMFCFVLGHLHLTTMERERSVLCYQLCSIKIMRISTAIVFSLLPFDCFCN